MPIQLRGRIVMLCCWFPRATPSYDSRVSTPTLAIACVAIVLTVGCTTNPPRSSAHAAPKLGPSAAAAPHRGFVVHFHHTSVGRAQRVVLEVCRAPGVGGRHFGKHPFTYNLSSRSMSAKMRDVMMSCYRRHGAVIREDDEICNPMWDTSRAAGFGPGPIVGCEQQARR